MRAALRFSVSKAASLRLSAVCSTASDVGERATGGGELRPAINVDPAQVARGIVAACVEKCERQVTHCDTDSRIGGHSVHTIELRFRSMPQLNPVGSVQYEDKEAEKNHK
jgi:hypothetical protein